MKIIITGRHFNVSDELKQYVEKKFSKIERYFHRLIDIQVTMYMEKHIHVIEAVINADGTRFHGLEKATDMYPAIDLLTKSLEKQAVKHKEKHSGHKAVSPGKIEQPVLTDEDEATLLFRQVSDIPKDEIEAFLEMKVDNRDFIIFKKYNSSDTDNQVYEDDYALIYKHDDGFKMVENPADTQKEDGAFIENMREFDIVILDDSIINPKLKLKKRNACGIKSMSVDHAVKEAMDRKDDFLPFLNSDTNFLNIICKAGDNFEVITPGQ